MPDTPSPQSKPSAKQEPSLEAGKNVEHMKRLYAQLKWEADALLDDFTDEELEQIKKRSGSHRSQG
jgi:hypothetical protein